jgi:hypothetical protein
MRGFSSLRSSEAARILPLTWDFWFERFFLWLTSLVVSSIRDSMLEASLGLRFDDYEGW